MMTHYHRPTFGSRLGAILAAVGSAVGLGNVWRFPYEAGQNGGAVFLIVYLGCVLLLGVPVMLAEFFLGRHTRRNGVGAFAQLEPGTPWAGAGYVGIFCAFFILGFYFVVAGWTLEYLFQSLGGSLAGKSPEQYTADFVTFIRSPLRPIFWAVVFILLTQGVISFGVKHGIERAAKLMMPLLFLLMIVLCVRSITLPGAWAGVEFLFRPDVSKLRDPGMFLSAMGQAFFSLSLGMGCMITYASYFGKNTHMQGTALSVAALDTAVAVLAGIMIFPAVFSFGLDPTQGPILVFATLPNVFSQMPLGTLWAFAFFLLLVIAALTSTISLHEVVTAYLHDEFDIRRSTAAGIVSGTVVIFVVLSSLSVNPDNSIAIFGVSFFDILDNLTTCVLMPLGGMLICLFVGWRIDTRILKAELTNKGSAAFYFFHVYVFFLRFVAPIAIGLILVYEIAGRFSPPPPPETTETVVSTIVLPGVLFPA